MVKILAVSFAVLLILWILNILISYPLRKRVGDGHDYLIKMVQNGNNLFYDLFGLVGVAIAWYVLSPARWAVLIIYAFFAITAIFSLLVSAFATLFAAIRLKENQFNESILCTSNLIEVLGSLVVLYVALHYLFNWI